MRKRILSFVMTLVMLLPIFPTMAIEIKAYSNDNEYNTINTLYNEDLENNESSTSEKKYDDENELYLFYAYPNYLFDSEAIKNDIDLIELHESILAERNSADDFFSILEYALENAGSLKTVITTWTDALGLTSVLTDDAADRAVNSLLEEIYQNESLMENVTNTTSKTIKTFNTTIKIIDSFYENYDISETSAELDLFLKDMCDKALFDEEITALQKEANSLTGSLTNPMRTQLSESICDYYATTLTSANEVLTICKTFCTILFMQDISIDLINYLINSEYFVTEINNSLKRLRTNIKSNFVTYFLDTYIKDKSIDKVLSIIESNALKIFYDYDKEMISNFQFTKLLAELCVKFGQYLIFDVIFKNANIEEVYTYCYSVSILFSIQKAINEKRQNIQTCCITSKEVEDFQKIYTVYSAAVKASLNSAQAMIGRSGDNKDAVDNFLQLWNNQSTNNTFIYQNYIQSCIDDYASLSIEERIQRNTSTSYYHFNGSNVYIGELLPTSKEYDYWIFTPYDTLYYGVRISQTSYLNDSEIYTLNTKLNIIGDFIVENGSYSFGVGADINVSGNCIFRSTSGHTDIIIDEYSKIIIGGNFSMKSNIFHNSASVKFVCDGELSVGGNVDIQCTAKSGMDIVMQNENSSIKIGGDFSCNDAPWAHLTNGEITLYGDANNLPIQSENMITILKGEKKQSITNCTFTNVVVENEKGVSFGDGVWIKGRLTSNTGTVYAESPLNFDSGTLDCRNYIGDIVSQAGGVTITGKLDFSGSIYGDWWEKYGDIVFENAYANIIGTIKIEKTYLSSKDSNKIIINQNSVVNVIGNVIFEGQTDYGVDMYVHGILNVTGVINQKNNAHIFMNENEFAEINVKGNFIGGTAYAYTWQYFSKGTFSCTGNVSLCTREKINKLILNGSSKQTVSMFKWGINQIDNCIIANEKSNVEFTYAISVNKLFDHQGNRFTLYQDGVGSIFVDYDNDGILDNVDPQPTVYNEHSIISIYPNSYYYLSDKILTVCEDEKVSEIKQNIFNDNIFVYSEDGSTELSDSTVVENGNRIVLYDETKTIIDEMIINSIKHEYIKRYTKKPTCTTRGYTIYRCSFCKHNRISDYIEKLWHSYDSNGICVTCSKVITADFLTFEGYQVRDTEYNGLRSKFIVDLTAMPTLEADGFEVIEYGTIFASTEKLTENGDDFTVFKNDSGVYDTLSYGKLIPVMKNGSLVGKYISKNSEQLIFACTITNFSESNFDKEVSIRGYAVLADADGNEYVVYCDYPSEDYRSVSLAMICDALAASGEITEENNISYAHVVRFRKEQEFNDSEDVEVKASDLFG